MCRSVQSPFILSEWNRERLTNMNGYGFFVIIFFLFFLHQPHKHAESPHDFHTANIMLSVS